MIHMRSTTQTRYVTGLVLLLLQAAPSQDILSAASPQDEVKASVGMERRVPWTTSHISGSPEPPLPYVTERAFPNLTFSRCLDLTAAPGSDRLFLVEQGGKIFSFPNQADVKSADLVIDFAKAIPGVEQVYALAFHPDFVRNQYCYVCYIKASNLPDGTHVARFRMRDSDPPTIDAKSETTLVTWLSG